MITLKKQMQGEIEILYYLQTFNIITYLMLVRNLEFLSSYM